MLRTKRLYDDQGQGPRQKWQSYVTSQLLRVGVPAGPCIQSGGEGPGVHGFEAVTQGRVAKGARCACCYVRMWCVLPLTIIAVSVPACGARTSMVTLSVSICKMGCRKGGRVQVWVGPLGGVLLVGSHLV
jgi:hypothetical protein